MMVVAVRTVDWHSVRPAVVKRALTDADVASVLAYAERYVGYRKDYMPADAKAPTRSRRSAAVPREGG